MTLGVAVLSLWGVARTTIITTDPDTDSDTDNTEDGTDQHPGQAVPDSALPATGGSGDRPGRG
jgi:hypothetical protein